MPSPGRTYTITLNETDAKELEDFLSSADDGERIIKVLRKQLDDQRPLAARNAARVMAVVELRQAAEGYRKRASQHTDAEWRAGCRADANDIDCIADLVEAGDDGRARRRTAGLDTAVRDEIPRSAYQFCGLRALR